MSTAYDLASLDMAGTTIDENELVYRVLESTVANAADTGNITSGKHDNVSTSAAPENPAREGNSAIHR